jgi:HPt (histidine-containing phosphotransfer) domain-containing protein
MSRQHPIELFMPPNMLKAKVGGGSGGIDHAAIKRAEGAMEELKGEFAGMAGDAVAALVAAQHAHAENPDPLSRGALLRAAHDIKGLAATFNFPLMAKVAGSLTQLLLETPDARALPMKLVEAHVAAVQAILRGTITGSEDKTTLLLLGELQTQVHESLKS